MSTKFPTSRPPHGNVGLLLSANLRRDGKHVSALTAQLSRRGLTVLCQDIAVPRALDVALAELRKECTTVIAGGIGIGALAALAAAQDRPDAIEGIALFEPDLIPQPDRRPVLGSLLGSIARLGLLPVSMQSPDSFGGLTALAGQVMIRLAEIRKPILIVLGEAPAAQVRQAAERLQWRIGGQVELVSGRPLAHDPVVPDLLLAFALGTAKAAESIMPKRGPARTVSLTAAE